MGGSTLFQGAGRGTGRRDSRGLRVLSWALDLSQHLQGSEGIRAQDSPSDSLSPHCALE